jgi:hypothetical protein
MQFFYALACFKLVTSGIHVVSVVLLCLPVGKNFSVVSQEAFSTDGRRLFFSESQVIFA